MTAFASGDYACIAPPIATPLVFTNQDGKQTVAIAAGGHDTPLSKIDTKLVVFGLVGE